MKILDRPSTGSIAGRTYSGSRSGQVVRQRAMPVHPLYFARRTPVRSAFSAATSQWSTLTAKQQAAWTAASFQHSASPASVLIAAGNGKALFVACQVAMRVLKQPPPTAPPASWARSVITISAFSVTPAGVVHATVSGSALSSSTAVYECTASQSPGTGAPGDFCYVFDDLGLFNGVESFGSFYLARFGNPISGWRVWCRAHIVSKDGVQGPRSVMSAIVA